MFRHYLLMAARGLVRHKLYSFINVVGLSVALACAILIGLANAIAWPVAWFYLHRWLEGYAYRITLDPVYFLAAGTVALLIAWTTVFAHTLALARTTPVHALRYE
ncbi:MAG: hypothetical protein ACRET5_12640 [Steroidobacteraceae bacterium]